MMNTTEKACLVVKINSLKNSFINDDLKLHERKIYDWFLDQPIVMFAGVY